MPSNLNEIKHIYCSTVASIKPGIQKYSLCIFSLCNKTNKRVPQTDLQSTATEDRATAKYQLLQPSVLNALYPTQHAKQQKKQSRSPEAPMDSCYGNTNPLLKMDFMTRLETQVLHLSIKIAVQSRESICALILSFPEPQELISKPRELLGSQGSFRYCAMISSKVIHQYQINDFPSSKLLKLLQWGMNLYMLLLQDSNPTFLHQ